MSATEIPKASDVIKEGEHFFTAAWDAAHKMIAETLTPVPAKAEAPKAEAHPAAAAKPADASAQHNKAGEHTPATDSKSTAPAAAPKPADHADTPASAGKDAASDKITSGDIQAAKSNNMGNVASFLYDAAVATGTAAFLPEVAIVGAAGSVAGAVASAVGGFFSSKPADKQSDKAAVPATVKAAADAQYQQQLAKHFGSVTESDKAFDYHDWLKQNGCSDGGDACKVSPDAMAGLGISLTPVAPQKVETKDGKVNAFQTAMTHEQWSDALAIVNRQAGSHLAVNSWDDGADKGQDKGSTVRDQTGKVTHYDANHKVDWTKDGDITTKYGDGGTITTVNSKTGDITMKDAQGHDMVQRDKNGKFTITPPNGEPITLDPKTSDVNIGTRAAANLATNVFTEGDTKITLFREAIHQGALNANTVFGGKPHVEVGTTYATIGANGIGIMVDIANKAAGISIDKNSVLLRDGQGRLSIHYKDGRPDQTLSADEQTKLLSGNSEDAQVLQKLNDMLITYIRTHKLNDGHGNEIATDGKRITEVHQGNTVVKVDAPTQAGAAATKFTLSALSAPTQKIDLESHTDDVIGADGKLQAHLAQVNGKTTVRTANVYFDGERATTSNGTVIGAQGVSFADGTDIRNDGVVIDQYGTNFDNAGDVVPTQGTYKTDVAKYSDGSQETAAKSQVSQAEGIAASIRGRVASGHVTAGDIAALAGSMASLSVLVSSMSQFGDAGALASAVMAEDEVAGSMEMAMASLHSAPAVMQAA